jgi:large subunit ribosomal protein L9
MEVVLRGTVLGLGQRGDVVKVSDGYARNYLLPKGLAIVATKGARDQAASMRRAAAERRARELQLASHVAEQIGSLTVNLAKRASKDGKLFGSVTANEVATRLSELAGVTVDRHQINLSETIKTTGEFSVPVRLHPEVEVAVHLVVEPES